MNTDEQGEQCLETLGDYRDWCASIGGEDCEAVIRFDEAIAQYGRDYVKVPPGFPIQSLLLSLLYSVLLE